MTIDQYMAEADKYPFLKPDEELENAKRSKEGDKKSREKLINSHLKLVVSIAKTYSRRDPLSGEFKELIQQGNLGLIEAADKFDPYLGFKFSTFALWPIKKYIHLYFDMKEDIRLPLNQRVLRGEIYKIIDKHVNANGAEPSPEYIANELNRNQTKKRYGIDDVTALLQMYENNRVSSLNKPIGDEDAEYSTLIPASDGKDLIEEISNSSITEDIRNHIYRLDIEDNIKVILREVLYEGKIHGDVAVDMGIKREEVRQKYEKGLRALRYALRNDPKFMEDIALMIK